MSTEARTPQSRSVLQVGPLKPSLAKTLQDDYAAYVLPDEPADFLAEHGEEITAVVTSGRTGVDAELMAALPNLGAVVNFGVGYDTTDVDAAAGRGVLVSNTPDVLTDCVADTAVGLMIDVMRQFSASDRYVREGRWPVDGNCPLTRQVSNKRVGIIGLGRIGSAIALRLSAFGCEISYHNRHAIEGSSYTYVGSPVELMDTAGQLQYQLRPFPDNSGPFIALIMHGNQAGDAAFSVDQYMRTDGAQNGYGTAAFDQKIDAAGELTGQQRQDAYAKLFAEEPNEVAQFAYIAHMNGVLAKSARVDYQPNSATGDEMRLSEMKFASADRTDKQ